ncbi:MAG: prephenate dehydratase [Angustibacter sp.]
MVEQTPAEAVREPAGWDELRSRARIDGVRVVTLGPAGTSSHDAARHLQTRLVEADGAPPLPLELHDTFDVVLERAVADASCLALVPSAYRGATAFHWHDELRLLFHFARSTPPYGLATRRLPVAPEPVRVAAMAEVDHLYGGLVPPPMAHREVVRVAARSTRHAAELVRCGAADVAVTNEPSRRDAGLVWLSCRPGVDIVWLVFARAPSEPRPRVHPTPDTYPEETP